MRGRTCLFDGAPWLPAGVAIDGEGSIHAGVDPALAPSHTGLVVEPHPVRHLTAGRLTIGGWQVDPIDLLAASLRRVAETARQYIDAPAWEVTVAVPATWGPRRRTLLRQAAHRASLDQPELVETPVAVAWHLLHTTIRENLHYAKPDATDAELERAVRAAQIHDHIAARNAAERLAPSRGNPANLRARNSYTRRAVPG